MIDSKDKEAQLLEDLKTATPNSSLNNNSRKTAVKTEINTIYNPAVDEIPAQPEPILFLGGTSILTNNNVTGIIAHPGSGKSAICEAVCSAVLNASELHNDSSIDTLNFKVGKEVKKVIYIDCERTNLDVYNSFSRMLKRCELSKDHKPESVVFLGLRLVSKLEDRFNAIEKLISEHKPELMIIDGAGDLVTDILNFEQALNVRIKFREWTSQNNLSILTTLHPNPGGTKPRGHIGSELEREAENMLFIEKVDDIQRNLTTDFAHGKSRNNGSVTTSFKWNDTKFMFSSCEVQQPKGKKLDAWKVLEPSDYYNLLTDIKKSDKTTSAEFKTYLKALLGGYENVKINDRAISLFVDHLQRLKLIDVTGTRNKRSIIVNEVKLKEFKDNSNID